MNEKDLDKILLQKIINAVRKSANEDKKDPTNDTDRVMSLIARFAYSAESHAVLANEAREFIDSIALTFIASRNKSK